MARKRISPMLLVQNEEGKNVFFYHHDEERAEQYGEPKKVFVIMDSSYFIGTWQFEKTIDGYIGYYDSLKEAEDGMIFIDGYSD